MLASIRTAAAKPMPISFMSRIGSVTKIANTPTHHDRGAGDDGGCRPAGEGRSPHYVPFWMERRSGLRCTRRGVPHSRFNVFDCRGWRHGGGVSVGEGRS
jgi:hypothetical protein